MRKTIATVLLAGTLAGGTAAAISTSSAGAATAPAATTSAKQAIKHPRLAAHRKAVRHAVVKISAATIGVSRADLVTELKSGKSIADVATAHQVAPKAVVDALVKAATTRIETAVTNHKLTRVRANKIEARLPAVATRIVNHHFGH